MSIYNGRRYDTNGAKELSNIFFWCDTICRALMGELGMSASVRAEARACPKYVCSVAWSPAHSAHSPVGLRVSSPSLQVWSASGYRQHHPLAPERSGGDGRVYALVMKLFTDYAVFTLAKIQIQPFLVSSSRVIWLKPAEFSSSTYCFEFFI